MQNMVFLQNTQKSEKMKKIKKHEFYEYDKNHRNPKNDQKVHFLKIQKKRVFQKTPYFFEIPK